MFGFRDAISADEAGLLIYVKDVGGLCNTIHYLLENIEICAAMVQWRE